MSKILDKIYSACYDLNKNISNLNEKDARFWAEVSKRRFALTTTKILEYSNKKDNVKILNASGLGSGDHDVSIVKYLRDIKFAFEWDVYDSPESPYLEKSTLKDYIRELNINLVFFDYTKINNNDNKKYDIILFTEIAEHLDHSSFLNALNYLNEKLEDDGVLIVTTPNALWLPARIKNLFGIEGNEYYGEGNKNLEKKVYGHIVYYTPQKLQRIVEDCGFKKLELITYDWLPFTESRKFIAKILNLLVDFSTLFGKATKGAIFLSVTKNNGNKSKIPFSV